MNYKLSLRSKAKHILYLVDACYGGISAVGARGLDSKVTPNYLDKILKYKSRQVISAGGEMSKLLKNPSGAIVHSLRIF